MPLSDQWGLNPPAPVCDCVERSRRNERYGLGLMRWWCAVHGVCEPCPFCQVAEHVIVVTPRAELARAVITHRNGYPHHLRTAPRQVSLFGDAA